MISGLPEVQMRHKNKSKESNVKGDFVEAGNQNKGKAIICSFRNKVIAWVTVIYLFKICVNRKGFA